MLGHAPGFTDLCPFSLMRGCSHDSIRSSWYGYAYLSRRGPARGGGSSRRVARCTMEGKCV